MRGNWSETEKKKARRILRKFAAANDGWSGIGARLDPKASKTTVHNWFARGRVPVVRVKALLKLAPAELFVQEAELCPEAKFVGEQA